MPEQKDFRPGWASAPGETISDILRERALSPSQLANSLGCTVEVVDELIQGRIRITRETAARLEAFLGASAEFWIAREDQYRSDVARLEQESQNESEEHWLGEIPTNDIVRLGWITPPAEPAEEARAFFNFFNVQTVGEWRRRYSSLLETTAFKTSPSFKSHPGAVAAWLRQGEIQAASVDCKPWQPEKFKSCLQLIRELTRRKDPNLFIPELAERCGECGVAVVVLRAPAGCRASGATFFVSARKAVLMLSFRYLSDDHFWFTFFHEAGHLLLHGPSDLFLEIGERETSTEEIEANEFAAHLLVPGEFRPALLALHADPLEVIRFARKIGVSPGIVVGQLQHLGQIRRNQLNNLKRRFRWTAG